MIARIVECTNYKTVYGILTVEDVEVEAVQDMIYKIKRELNDEIDLAWCIDDIFERFPDDWVWSFIDGDDLIEI